MPKLLVIGLDCASPELVFDKFRKDLPNLRRLMEKGCYGRMKSCFPAITIPAWMVMLTGKQPGELGLYGFRHRKGNSYKEMWISNSGSIKAETVWDKIAKEGKNSCLIGVPPSYPPKKIKGNLISCFITPGWDSDCTWPRELKKEIEDLVGEYTFDVEFRTEDRDKILEDLFEMTEKRFSVIKHLLKEKEWDFFMWVEIGVDRVHHAFWKFFDPEHHLYEPGNKYENVIRDYYIYLDKQIGEILGMVDKDTRIMVVSDHGVKRMKGAFCVNEWLIKEGYLVLNYPSNIVSPEKADIDWGKTKAWGWGGYYARIFLNVEGREEKGIVKREDYEAMRNELREKILNIRDPDGNLMDNKVYKPEEIYPECRGDPPDLMVYFDNLYWRSAGTVGHNKLYLAENDRGPDDAMHSEHGIFILYDPKNPENGRVKDVMIGEISDIMLSILK